MRQRDIPVTLAPWLLDGSDQRLACYLHRGALDAARCPWLFTVGWLALAAAVGGVGLWLLEALLS